MDNAVLMGYMGARMAQEVHNVEFLSLGELDDHESFSKPAFTWINAETSPDPGRETLAETDGLMWVPVDPLALAEDRADAHWQRVRAYALAVSTGEGLGKHDARGRFFARLKESRVMKLAVLRGLREAATMTEVYGICNGVVEFDNATPAWMVDGVCTQYGLRPMEDLFNHVARAFDRAERQVRRQHSSVVAAMLRARG